MEKLFELDGWMKANGINGDSGGGGASGGTVRAVGRHFEGELTISGQGQWFFFLKLFKGSPTRKRKIASNM